MNQTGLMFRLAVKDLKIEYRSPQAFLTTLFFALLILVVFHFAFDPGSSATREATPGILWVSLLFPGIIQLNRSFQTEMEEGTLWGLLLSPLRPGALFLGKLLANWVVLLAIDLVILGAFVIFFNLAFSLGLLWVLLLVGLTSIGFAAVGTVFAAMVSGIQSREVLLPILLFPILIPIILAAVNGSQEVLVGQIHFLGKWIQLIAVFDVVFVAVAFVLFDYVIGE